ncbi:uncharacterized protein V1513DRAFT_458395 [Lipomyces chichibuensis]|uniref:uncharacterized protein n=1 Tax=Lipomyces chichibuensis TaxID=1546026 RepID=UPI0033438BB3
MSYRIENAKQGRAGCKGPACKSEGVKIGKGELRLGVFVTIGDNQSWQWRHWSCVTPQVIQNIKTKVESLPQGLDGYDEISAEDQKRVAGALEEGHVADSEYKGDIETNRLGAKNPRKRRSKNEAPDDEEERENGETKTEETTGEKMEQQAEEAGKSSTRGRKKRASTKRPSEDGEVDDEKKRQRVDESKDSDDLLAGSVKRGRGRPKKSDAASTQSAAPALTGSTESAEVPAKRGRGRPKKEFKTKPNQDISEPPKRGRGRPKLTEEQRLEKDKTKEAAKKALAPQVPADQRRGRGRPRKYAQDAPEEKSAGELQGAGDKKEEKSDEVNAAIEKIEAATEK